MNRTKKLISDTFWELLEEKSYNRITVQNIVERCQLNRNTFYYYFQDIPLLAEYSIREWTEQVIQDNCVFGMPEKAIVLIAKELMKRKNAFLHIYRSSCGERLIRHLNELALHLVELYIDGITEKVIMPDENRVVITRFYKCIFMGLLLDWMDGEVSYDLPGFCEKVCEIFAGVDELIFMTRLGTCNVGAEENS